MVRSHCNTHAVRSGCGEMVCLASEPGAVQNLPAFDQEGGGEVRPESEWRAVEVFFPRAWLWQECWAWLVLRRPKDGWVMMMKNRHWVSIPRAKEGL